MWVQKGIILIERLPGYTFTAVDLFFTQSLEFYASDFAQLASLVLIYFYNQ